MTRYTGTIYTTSFDDVVTAVRAYVTALRLAERVGKGVCADGVNWLFIRKDNADYFYSVNDDELRHHSATELLFEITEKYRKDLEKGYATGNSGK